MSHTDTRRRYDLVIAPYQLVLLPTLEVSACLCVDASAPARVGTSARQGVSVHVRLLAGVGAALRVCAAVRQRCWLAEAAKELWRGSVCG